MQFEKPILSSFGDDNTSKRLSRNAGNNNDNSCTAVPKSYAIVSLSLRSPWQVIAVSTDLHQWLRGLICTKQNTQPVLCL